MKINSVDQYISNFSYEMKGRMEILRKTIITAAPEAEEHIAYQMPAYKLNGILVYFAGYKNHIGFYALPTAHAEFQTLLTKYKTGKGSVQFPNHEDLPIELIQKMVLFRVKENLSKQAKTEIRE